MTATDYCTEIDPKGSGEERCGPACAASAQCTLVPGNYDRYELMRAWTARINDLRAAQYGPGYVQRYGTTSDDLIAAAPSFGLHGRKWTTWDEYERSIAAGQVALALVNNWMLQPRDYPAGKAWDARHWIRIMPLDYAGKRDQVYLLAFDPLTYLLGEYPGAYQGPSCMTIASVRAAIAATVNDDGTPIAEAGIVLTTAA